MTRLARFDGTHVAHFPPGIVESLLDGGMVIYPTDTLYGLGVDPRHKEGLRKLFTIKGREGKKAIPLLLDDAERAFQWASRISGTASRLMGRFWPGGLTVVMPARPEVPEQITGGGGTVGLRVPDHPIARALARALGGAITGTSANRAGNPGNWSTPEEIVREFTGDVDWVLWDAPATSAVVEPGSDSRSPGSTVVRVEEDDIVLLREGAIPFRHITDFLGKG